VPTYHRLRNFFGPTRWNFYVMWNFYVHGQCHIGARSPPNVPYGQKSFWTHPMVLLGDKAQVVACFGPFLDSDNLDAI
jgi:hypothetical protein